ncbi:MULTISPECIES: TatD family hydrolase [unclassified Arsukibacterium]|uniref:TatD family hydrolase n=1 Tax=unclassified Arsukibacterium TaxID=2635278 RepID=UPI000C40248F|nr:MULTISPECIES: TatD family hydrolase [unclassified Arsukibacterium]MAA94815.1 hydrolase TatD [Rheinheimera sp.]MBM34728.1 hydrolase TatD [Rheinheimera sp.]HAW93030.1 hydrolase TatD [Candidatus Azambacteria bacterium]|tara:strand:- start:1200 stop:2006 length:807 start_codon:yes stop_codon:yes gene_type:complete
MTETGTHPGWFDCGVNLFSTRFAGIEQQIQRRAQQAGVNGLLLIGSDIDESRQNQQFCITQGGSYTTAGVHPHQAANVANDWLEQLASLLALPAVVAVGECGLDFNRDFSPRLQQQYVFASQLQLAKNKQKPVYLHERDAFTTQLGMLKEQQVSHGVAHCFTGDSSQLKAYLDLGLYIGVTGWVCDERRGQSLQQAIQYLPLDRILLETDAPYLLPRTIKPRPKYNEPALLPVIATEICRLKNISSQQLARCTTDNARRLFTLNGLPT